MLLHWKKSKEDYQKLMREKIETELKFLKSQLNPHFLFNTLNNLYYLAPELEERLTRGQLTANGAMAVIGRDNRETLARLWNHRVSDGIDPRELVAAAGGARGFAILREVVHTLFGQLGIEVRREVVIVLFAWARAALEAAPGAAVEE